ncbi:MAG: DNA internalization-related competence protein ComEC/Rec2 [Oscillospiraceae bacterium]|nr:DNA internalization-related competence protein ComEC/Rec2 [Oscillospiraceae bacterium]
MRFLLLFTVGFALACILGVYAVGFEALIWCGTIALAAGVVCLLTRTKKGKAGFVICMGVLLGFFWLKCYDDLYLSNIRRFDTKTVSATVTVTDFSYETYYGTSAAGMVELDGKQYRVRIYIDDAVSLTPADQVFGQLELRATTAEGAAESDYHQGIGLFLVGYVQDGAIYQKAERIPARYFPAVLKKEILECIDRCFPEDTLAFARALLLGDTKLLTYEEDTAFQVSGIRHVVAVSGLHVAILFSLIYTLAGKRRLLTALLGIPTLLLFAAVAGFTPSVVRACTMQILMILALLLNKDYDSPTALSAAILVMLVSNPMCVQSVSLQLSVGCMVGIFLFYRRLHKWFMQGSLKKMAKGKSVLSKILRWCVGSISVSLSAMVVTTPLIVCYFGVVSLIGVLINVLCLWMISGIFYGIMFCCVVGMFWVPGGQAIAFCVSIPIRFIKSICFAAAKVPFAAVYTESDYIVLWLIVAYCVLGLFFAVKKKRPLVLAASLIVSLGFAIGATLLEPVLGNYLVTVMDVGQGQCVLLRCAGRHYLVDCGSQHGQDAADKAAAVLLSQGIISLDGVILTHYDADHANGVELLMSRIPTKTLYLPDAQDPNTDFREELTTAFSERITFVSGDVAFGTKDWRITLFAAQPGKVGNESSLCVLFQRQDCDILITGDRSTQDENLLLEKWQIPKLELLVVGHHGSASSTGLRLLEATKPAAAAISVGKDNLYGHPAKETLGRLELYNCPILRTDLHGDIHFRR